jgi:cytochrome c553
MLRWGGIALAGIVVLLLFVVFGVYASAETRLNKTYTIAVESLTIPTDTQAIIRGEHWTALYCADCHGANSAGKVIFDDPALGHIAAGNLTRGKGGVAAVYRDADWIRAIRHGVGPDGKALLGMPSADFYNLSDRDLGELIAYLKVLPPVDAVMEERSLTPFGKVLIGAGVMHDAMQAEGIDHGGARPPAPAPAVSTAYGEYLVRSTGCRTCHGAALTGGTSPDPKAPPAPDITQRGALRLWSEQMFIGQARTRVGEFMPWKVLNAMSDDELRAMWLYLKAVPVQ